MIGEASPFAALWEGAEPRFPADWRHLLRRQVEAALSPERHGRWPEWASLLSGLPSVSASRLDFASDTVTIGSGADCDAATRARIEECLHALHPWRKGPFSVYGITIDAEWRSDWKWRRLQGAIAPLAGRAVLDVGCGNGYYAWRMLGCGAELVIGIDPTLSHIAQFLAIKHWAGDWPVHALPLGIEDLPAGLRAFDTVFSMGVLYHRRSPLDHLLELRDCLRPGGQLVLETLVVEGDARQVLLPADRYAQMRNVWFIPSCDALLGWLGRCGFRDARMIDVTATTSAEQRATDWMRFQSLADFLDPSDSSRTREGLPAPRRAVVLAESP
ncbi:MAG: tRNA 5-methoxyuridine(34)/uridine 5-oxyacetic acid(34) synthase CmoB [Methylotetracoccus sp.]